MKARQQARFFHEFRDVLVLYMVEGWASAVTKKSEDASYFDTTSGRFYYYLPESTGVEVNFVYPWVF